MPIDLTRRQWLAGLSAASTLALLPREAQARVTRLDPLPGTYGAVMPGVKQNLFWLKQGSGQGWMRALRGYTAPGLNHVIANTVDHDLLAGAPYDAVAEFFFRDLASLQAAPRLGTQAKRFLQMATREVVFRSFDGFAPPPGAIKRFGLVRRRPEISRPDFLFDWRDVHGTEANATKGLIRYTINVAIPELSPDCPWDGYAELWWESREAYEIATRLRAAERAAQAAKGVVPPGIPAVLAILKPELVR